MDVGAAYEGPLLDEPFPAVEEVAGHMKPPKRSQNHTGGTAPIVRELAPWKRLLDRIDGRCGAYCRNVMNKSVVGSTVNRPGVDSLKSKYTQDWMSKYIQEWIRLAEK